MFEDEKILTENTCCLCLNDDESTFSADSIMKSLPLHEMVNFCIGIEVRVREKKQLMASVAFHSILF